jgi:hypothetical protein
VFVDTWDLERISACRFCYEKRKDRLIQMNLHQDMPPPVECPICRPN